VLLVKVTLNPFEIWTVALPSFVITGGNHIGIVVIIASDVKTVPESIVGG